MIFILGADQKADDKQEQHTTYCSRCHNQTRWTKSKVTRRVTLFFLPVLPYKTEYFRYCPVCRNAEEISAAQYETN